MPRTPAAYLLNEAEMEQHLEQVGEWHGGSELVEPFSAVPELVPRTATPLVGLDLARMFENGHELARGRPIGSKTLAETALAIIGVENANGRAIIQHNWGNYSCTPSTWSGPMWQTPTPQQGQPLYFRAYQTHEGGCSAWWRLMYRSHRRALVMAAKGRPDLMVDALYDSHYVVGGSQSGYRRNACLFANQYRRERLFRFRGLSHVGAADMVGAGTLAASLLFVGGLHVKRWLEFR